MSRKSNNFVKDHPVWFSVILILISVALTMSIFLATDNLTNLGFGLNPDNLIKVGDDGNISLVSKNYEDGLKISVNEIDGSVKINGNTKQASSGAKLLYATVELEAGTYCLTSGYKDTATSGVYMNAESGGKELCKADMSNTGKDGVFTLTEAATVEIFINVAPAEYTSTITLRPVLVAGEEKGSFLA